MRATTSGSAGAEGDTESADATHARKRYAVVSCHVERPLEDGIWARFTALQERRPGGFPIAALMRPPDPAAGEERTTGSSARGRPPHAGRSATTPTGRRRTTRGPPEATRGARARRGRRLRELGSRRRSSAAAGGTRTPTWPTRARSSGTSTARRARRDPLSRDAESRGRHSRAGAIGFPRARLSRRFRPRTRSAISLARSPWRALPPSPRLLPRHRSPIARRRRALLGVAAPAARAPRAERHRPGHARRARSRETRPRSVGTTSARL